MDTELKKQLIDAGYRGINGRMDFLLEELIEACGDEFIEIVQRNVFTTGTHSQFVGEVIKGHNSVRIKSYEAVGLKDNDDSPTVVSGSTPAEAVANLFIGLHRK